MNGLAHRRERPRALHDAMRAGLVWVVLLLAAGVLGMHSLGTGHGGHGAPGTMGATSAAPDHHEVAASATASASAVSRAGTTTVALIVAEAGHGCDGCAAEVGTMCLAVLSALVLLLLHHRTTGSMSSPPAPVRGSGVPRHVVPGGWLPPPRLLLCVSRT